MAKNVGKIDGTVRVVAGVVILAAGGMMHSLWGLVGLIPLATGLMHRCPLYCPLSMNTGSK